jgi:hypothetical protein
LNSLDSLPMGDGIPLLLSEADLDARVLIDLQTRQAGDQVLGGDVTGVTDAIAGAVLRKIQRLLPSKEYDIVDVTIKFTLGGELLGVKVGGDVSVKLSPKKPL